MSFLTRDLFTSELAFFTDLSQVSRASLSPTKLSPFQDLGNIFLRVLFKSINTDAIDWFSYWNNVQEIFKVCHKKAIAENFAPRNDDAVHDMQ